jgi:hypothetical protein
MPLNEIPQSEIRLHPSVMSDALRMQCAGVTAGAFRNALLSVFHIPALAHHRHLDLSRIGQFLLDLLGNVA